MNTIRLLAPAKVNLYLAITGKRRDGYHNIVTLFHKIRLFDTVYLKKIPRGIIVTCDQPDVPLGKTNLAYKAAARLRRFCPAGCGARIHIAKKIPIGSGLGGGSSDAAAVLLGLNRLWRLKLSRKKLIKIGRQLGADVPFLTCPSRTAIGRGIGDCLEPVRTRIKYWFVVVVPPKSISTKEIYSKAKQFLTNAEADVKLITCAFKKKDIPALEAYLYNSLEPITIRRCRPVALIKQQLKKLGGHLALMSGSGSSVFTITNSKKEAAAIRERLRMAGWQVFVADSL